MPTYVYRCEACGNEFETFHSMSDDSLTHCARCDEHALRRVIQAPMIVPDIEPFQSIVTGETITGRKHLRNHLDEHNMVQVGDSMSERQKRYKQSEFEQKLDWHKRKGVPLPPQEVRDTWSRDG